MNILIINHNGGSIYHGPNLRTYFAAKELVKLGHVVTIVSSSYSHKYSVLPKVEGEVTSELIDGINYKWIHCIQYRNLFERICSHFQFGFKLLLNSGALCKDPKLVMFSGPPPEVFVFSWMLAKYHRAPIISDVRDFWPLTQIEMNRWQWLNPYTYILFLSQYLMFRLSNILVSPLPGAKKYINRICRKKNVRIIENGYELSDEKKPEEVRLKAICGYEQFGLKQPDLVKISQIRSKKRFVVGYSGGFDRDNDVESLISAANQINDNEGILFLLVGAGVRVDYYRKLARGNKNIVICDRVPAQNVPSVLNVMDICYCGLKPKSIYQYGVSLAKSYEYMAASKPIIWMIDAYNNPINDSGGGFAVEPDNVEQLVRVIRSCSRMDETRLVELGRKNYQHLCERYSYQVLGRKWDEMVHELIN